MARIPLVPSEDWPPEMMKALAPLMPPDDQRPPPGEERPRGGTVLEAFANHPALAAGHFALNGHILWHTSLEHRWRHILIMRTAVRRNAPFLWAEHVFHARDSGLTDEELARIAWGPEAPFFTDLEVALIRAADEIIDDGAVAEPTWEALAAELTPQQLLDVVFTVGCYQMVAAMVRSADLDVDPAIADMIRAKPS